MRYTIANIQSQKTNCEWKFFFVWFFFFLIHTPINVIKSCVDRPIVTCDVGFSCMVAFTADQVTMNFLDIREFQTVNCDLIEANPLGLIALN